MRRELSTYYVLQMWQFLLKLESMTFPSSSSLWARLEREEDCRARLTMFCFYCSWTGLAQPQRQQTGLIIQQLVAESQRFDITGFVPHALMYYLQHVCRSYFMKNEVKIRIAERSGKELLIYIKNNP